MLLRSYVENMLLDTYESVTKGRTLSLVWRSCRSDITLYLAWPPGLSAGAMLPPICQQCGVWPLANNQFDLELHL